MISELKTSSHMMWGPRWGQAKWYRATYHPVSWWMQPRSPGGGHFINVSSRNTAKLAVTDLEQGSANSVHKGPDRKDFRLSGSFGLHCSHSAQLVTVQKQPQTMQMWVWLCSNKTTYRRWNRNFMYFHVTNNSLLGFFSITQKHKDYS